MDGHGSDRLMCHVVNDIQVYLSISACLIIILWVFITGPSILGLTYLVKSVMQIDYRLSFRTYHFALLRIQCVSFLKTLRAGIAAVISMIQIPDQ